MILLSSNDEFAPWGGKRRNDRPGRKNLGLPERTCHLRSGPHFSTPLIKMQLGWVGLSSGRLLQTSGPSHRRTAVDEVVTPEYF